jgi:putative FmdB family regulatory protein
VPIYEYSCKDCAERFEELVSTSAAEKVACPSCGSRQVDRVYSTFATEWKPSNVNWHRLPSRTGW